VITNVIHADSFAVFLMCVPLASAQVRKMMVDQKPRKDLATLFPGANKDSIDLMNSMLQYDPSKRPSAADALQSKWIEAQHDPENEPDAPGKIDFDFERRSKLSTEDVGRDG